MKIERSDTELKEASDHLFYEMWMMNRLAAILEDSSSFSPFEETVSYTNTTEVSISLRSTGIIKPSDTIYDKEDIPLVLNNAVIEAFAVHVRSLLDFFYKKATDDDVVAEHFFSSPEIWVNARPQKSQDEIRKIKIRINKEIAHLTYARQKAKSKTWSYKQLQRNLNNASKVFLDLVSNNLLGKRWK